MTPSRRPGDLLSLALRRVARPLVAGAVLASSPTTSAAAPAGDDSSAPRSSSWWLRTGEGHQQRGEHARAGEAYRQALLALSPTKQRANEGARAAMLSAEAYWLAFEGDASVASLEAGIAVLEQWLEATGPQSKASLVVDVQRMVARLRAVRDPLVAADEALARGDVDEASAHDEAALDALATQDRQWSIGASLALRAADDLVAAYDASAGKGKGEAAAAGAPQELAKARELLVRWKQRRPAGDASPQGPRLEQRLAELEQRLAEAEREAAEAAAAEERRAEAARAEAERRERERARAEAASRAEPEGPAPGERRTLAIVLVASGAAAVGAGAGLLGEGLVFSGLSRDRAAAARAQADALAQTSGARFDRAGFEAALADYQATADRRDLGMIIGGSVLAAGGIAAGVVGTVWLVRARGSGQRARARAPALVRATPVVSATSLRLLLTTRF